MTHYVVAFDVSSNKSRKKIGELLLGFGCRVQLSVFEVVLTSCEMRTLIARLNEYLADDDSILYYPMCSKDVKVRQYSGSALQYNPGSFFIT